MLPTLFHVPLPEWRLPLDICGPVVWLVGLGLWCRISGTRAFLPVAAVGVLGGGAVALLARNATLTLGAMPVTAYGATLALGACVAWMMIRDAARVSGASVAEADRLFLSASATALVGAHAVHVLAHVERPGSLLGLLNVREGGMNVLGGVLGGWAALRFLALDGLELRRWLDRFTPGVLAGAAILRVGDYVHGSAFGLPLATRAPHWLEVLGSYPRWAPEAQTVSGAPAWIHQVMNGSLSPDSQWSLPVHPVQLYESLFLILLSGVALYTAQRRPFPGALALFALAAYCNFRWAVEWYSADSTRVPLPGPVGLWFSVQLSVAALAFVLGPGAQASRAWRVGVGAYLALVAILSAASQLGTMEPPRHVTLVQIAAMGAVAAAAFWWRTWRHPAANSGAKDAPATA